MQWLSSGNKVPSLQLCKDTFVTCPVSFNGDPQNQTVANHMDGLESSF